MISLSTVVEAGSSVTLVTVFVDENGASFQPKELYWSLYRMGEVVNEKEDVQIDISNVYQDPDDGNYKVDTVLHGDDLPPGLLYFVVYGKYDSTIMSDRPYRTWAQLTVRQVPHL